MSAGIKEYCVIPHHVGCVVGETGVGMVVSVVRGTGVTNVAGGIG